ncbi:MAG: CapA family protein [Candidatus Paceibacterota bacterium]|jgi:poly-gamma-glutamate synthesis protein (capsule biosynthesis protein)
MRNAALAGILAICLMAGLAVVSAKQNATKKNTEAVIIPPVKFAVVGDIMLGRQVGTLMDTNGYDYPLKNISSFLKNFDLSVGNFGGTVREKYNYRDGLAMKFSFSPKSIAQLIDANFGVVSIANNHAFDYGAPGFDETKTNLQASGISPIGHPYDLSKGIVTTVELRDKKITFMAFNATVPVFDTAKAGDLIAKARTENPGSLLVVLAHWGDEYAPEHNSRQESLGRAFVDRGADIVLGSHPHVVQDIERYKNKLIFYSLGNFIFDQNFSDETRRGLMLGVQLNSTTTELGLFPINITKSQSVLMSKAERASFLAAIAEKSPAELASAIKNSLISF